MSANAPTKSSGTCQLQPWETPKATLLLAQCSAMQGHSEPVRAYRRQSTKPKKASGTRYEASEPPAWTAPKSSPVTTAAGRSPRQLRSAREDVAAEEELLGDRRHDGHEHRDRRQPVAAVDAELLLEVLVGGVQPERRHEDRGERVEGHPGQHGQPQRPDLTGAGRSPNCAGVGVAHARAKRRAAATNATSWTTVLATLTHPGRSLRLAPPAAATTPSTSAPMSAPASPVMSARMPDQGRQPGRAPPGGAPSGRSGAAPTGRGWG